MDASRVLAAYLNTTRKRAALKSMVNCDPSQIDAIQRAAVRRYAENTLTLSELTLFAHDLATVCPSPEAERLFLGLPSAKSCCVRNARLEALEQLRGWLAS